LGATTESWQEEPVLFISGKYRKKGMECRFFGGGFAVEKGSVNAGRAGGRVNLLRRS
jgi:hypothetical protein